MDKVLVVGVIMCVVKPYEGGDTING
jgi:hypothetical protein